MPPRVLVSVRRDEDVDGRDLEVPASLPASELRRLVARGLDWPAATPETFIRVEPGGRVLGERETLDEAGVRDGAWLVFTAQPGPQPGASASPFGLGTSRSVDGTGFPRVMRSRPPSFEPNGWVVLAVCAAVIVGAVVALVLLSRPTPSNSPATPTGVVSVAPPVATPVVVAAPTLVPTTQPTPQPTPLSIVLDRATVAPTVQPTVAPTAPPTLAPTVAPTAAPTVEPTPLPTPVPSAATVWPATLAQLDPLWGRDWPGAIGVLQGFLERFPDDTAATDKLYAALVEYGSDLAASGQTDQARAALQGAATLRPGRSEAADALQALAPRPTPVPQPAIAATAVPAPPPGRVAAPPAQQEPPPPVEEPPAPPVKQPVTRDGFDAPAP